METKTLFIDLYPTITLRKTVNAIRLNILVFRITFGIIIT